MKQFWSWLAVILLSGSLPAIGADAEAFRRWAILAAPEVRESGVSDLLTAQLTAAKVELVEREQLDAVTREIELSKLLGADAAAQRLKVGQLTKADALILLSLVEHDNKKFVKLVISDCRYGSRLRLEHFPFAADGVERLVKDVAGAVDETRKRFARGVERIVAVPPFVSQNLTHDFDYHQSGYAMLLQLSLASAPGVAVLEVEEARQIQQELMRAGAELDRRRVPVFVEGEFEVTGTTEKPVVRLAVEVVGAKSDRQRIERSGLNSDEVVKQLTQILPATLWRMLESAPQEPLSHQQQFERLTARAQVLADVQSFEHSVALREAALLLNPSDVGQRLSLVQEYLTHSLQINDDDSARRKAWSNSSREVQQTTKQPPFRFPERRQLCVNGAAHLEFLLSRRLLNAPEAARLVSSYAGHALILIYPDPDTNVPGPAALYHEIGWRLLPRLPHLDPQLRRGTFHSRFQSRPVPGTLPAISITSQQILIAKACIKWEKDWIESLLSNRQATPDDVKLWLAHVERLFTDVFPTDSPLPQPLDLMLNLVPEIVTRLKAPESDLRGLYQRLAIRPDAPGLYGRLGLLQLDGDTAKTAEALRTLQRELLVVRSDFAQLLEASDCDDKRAVQLPMFASIDAVDARWRRKELLFGQPNDSRLVKKHPLPRNPIPAPAPRQRVQFRPLELSAPWIGWKRCTDLLDVAWSHTQADVIEPGRPPRKILSVELPDRIVSVTWDGEVFWIPTIQRGIQLISPSGELVAQLPLSPSGTQPDATGSLVPTLPPIESVAVIHENSWRMNRGPWPVEFQGLAPLWPIEPGRCLAVGLIGRERRGWVAELRRSSTRPSVVTSRIFHTATKTLDPSGTAAAVSDPQLMFLPTFMLELSRNQQRSLLIGRRQFNGVVELPPLMIDLSSLDVRVNNTQYVPKSMYSHYVASGDRVVASSVVDLQLLMPGTSFQDAWEHTTLFHNHEVGRWGTAPNAPSFAAAGGSVLIPGRHWSRADVRQGKYEALTTHRLPWHQRFEFFAPSAVYGCVAWNLRDRLYQVLIDQPWDDWDKDENTFVFIPEAQRQKHAAAVRRIHELGGHVGTMWGAYGLTTLGWTDPTWATVVFLPAEWKGGDEELHWLEDLYQLVDLRLVQAPITNAGAERLGRMTSIQQLRLIETKITDEGLRHLKNLTALRLLHLEGTARGNEFTNRGLEHVSQLERLGILNLYGPSFTDEGLAWLHRFRSLSAVNVIDTNLSPSGMSKLLTEKRGVTFNTHPHFPIYSSLDTEWYPQ